MLGKPDYMSHSEAKHLKGREFSLILGGPFFQLLYRAKLTGNALELLKQRIIIIAMFAWLPLFVLSVVSGQAWGDGLKLPFMQDFDIHIRFLVALPLFIVAELVVHQRILLVIEQFEVRNLVPDEAAEQFNGAIASALRLRNSIVAEAIMIVVIYVVGYQLVWHQTSAVDATVWYLNPSSPQGSGLSLAGMWFRFVSLPLFQFFLLRWYYRLFIWGRFLYQVSRIRLNLVASHPDRFGGLGFLSLSVYAFMPLALAHGVMLAGPISNHIFYEGAQLLDFKFEVLTIVLFVVCLVVLPLLAFTSQLTNAKRIGEMKYGRLASQFVQGFEAQWLKDKGPIDNAAIGCDIQSLSDLSNSLSVVENMQVIPIPRNAVISLAVITIVPILPLVLTMMPIGELVKIIAGILF